LTNLQEKVKKLSVVCISNIQARDTFTLVLSKLTLKNVLIEETLQLLVGDIYAQLLKTVVGEIFKTVNVKNAN
jgi:hypothetical protein